MVEVISTTSRSPFRFSLRTSLAWLGICAAILGVAASLQSPEVAVAATIVIVGITLRRFGLAPIAGVIAWILGAEMFLAAWLLDAETVWMPNFPQLLSLFIGTISSIIAAVIFVAYQSRSTTGSLVGLVLSAVFPIGWFLAASPYLDQLRAGIRARQAAEDAITIRQIVIEVEAIRAKLGRAPIDERELERFLGKPLPCVRDYGVETPINYRRTGENSFHLQYELWATDDWIYDSTMPQKGWVQHWY